MNKLIIFGAGAHARRVAHIAGMTGWTVCAFVDDKRQEDGQLLGIPVLQRLKDTEPGTNAIVAIGDHEVRERIHVKVLQMGFILPFLTHPFSSVAPDVVIARGTVVLAGAVIESQARVGEGVIIDIGALIDHDAIIEDFCHIKPGAVINSGSCVKSHSIVS